MDRLNNMLISAKFVAGTKISNFKKKLRSTENGDTQVVVALILIVVAVGLCIIFQNEINDILTQVGGKVSDTVNKLSNFTVVGQNNPNN